MWIKTLQPPLISFIGLLILPGIVSCGSGQLHARISAQVQRVVDGDTIEVKLATAQSRIEDIRLTGIDAPESRQLPWGKAAKDFLQQQIGDSSVYLEFDVKSDDRYDRKLAYVWKDGVLLNETMVASGHALAVSYFPNVRYQERFDRAQEAARLQGLGIWDLDNPMGQTPEEFRRQASN